MAARRRPRPGGTDWAGPRGRTRRAVAEDPSGPTTAPCFGQPVTTLDAHLARGLRVEALAEIVEGLRGGTEDDEAILGGADLRFGPPILQPASMRDFYAFEQHVADDVARRGHEIPEAGIGCRSSTSATCRRSAARTNRSGRRADRSSSTTSSRSEPSSTRPPGTCRPERAEEAIGGFTILNDWSARDLQREETTVRLGPAKGKDFATSIGPWLVTPDELTDARSGTGYELAMTAEVNGTEISRGTWSAAHSRSGRCWPARRPTRGSDPAT